MSMINVRLILKITGGDISRINDSKNDAMKNYSALDRTASALPNNMNYQQQMTARNNAQTNLQDNISRFSTQSISTSNTSSSTNPSIYPPQRSNMPITSYSNTPSTNSNQQQLYQQQQMSYQQQRQIPSSLPEQQNLQQKQQMQPTNNPQVQHPKPAPSNVGQSTLPGTSMMSPNQIQPVLKQHTMPSERSTIHQPNPNDVQTTSSVQQLQQGYVGKPNSLPQSLHGGDYPKNIPMLALQQQKVRMQKRFKNNTAFKIHYWVVKSKFLTNNFYLYYRLILNYRLQYTMEIYQT
jgi:hypothetical protein